MLAVCRYVFCHVNGASFNRAMPMSINAMSDLSSAMFIRAGQDYKGSRSWRRLLITGPVSNALAKNDFSSLPGIVAAAARLGGWAPQEMAKSTPFIIYTSSATDSLAQDILVPNTGAAQASERKAMVRVHALQAMRSEASAPSGVCNCWSGLLRYASVGFCICAYALSG